MLQEIVNSIGGIANIITAILIIAGFIMTVTKRGKEIVSNWFKKINAPTNNGLLCVLRREVRNMCKDYIKKGYISEDEEEEFVEAYKAYDCLGGNSYTHKLVKRASGLPVKKDIDED